MHPAKRRRLDAANSTLTKPFRSPLHVDPGQTQAHSIKKLNNVDQVSQEPDTVTLRQPLSKPVTVGSSPLRNVPSSPLHDSSKSKPTSLSSPIRPSQPILTRPARIPRSAQDAIYINLQKDHSSLTQHLKKLNQSVDTANQALRCTTTSANNDLPSLITKWRFISRDCAEELFTIAKDRVNKMGGVGAWREKYEKRNQDRSTSWGTEIDTEAEEEDLTDEQREQLDYLREEAMQEARKYGLDRPEENEVQVEKDDDTFTMDMMLKQLNVDLELIGYDKMAQRWVD